MYARVRRIKEGMVAASYSYHDNVVYDMEKLSGSIQIFKPYLDHVWFNDRYGYHWHKSWLSFKPRLTFKCPVCGKKMRIRINLKVVKDLNKVKVKNPVQCKKCGFSTYFVDVEKRELLKA